MQNIIRVGVDLAKSVFQVHAVDEHEHVIVNKPIRPNQFLQWCLRLPKSCIIAFEASAGAHHWGRTLSPHGFNVRIYPAHLVAPYRRQGRTGKNDANDSAAICEAASRPHLPTVPIKTAEQQSVLVVHSMREGFKEERTACINRIRGWLAEFGITVSKSPNKLSEALPYILEDAENTLTMQLRTAIIRERDHWEYLEGQMAWCDEQILEHGRQNALVKKAERILGIGKIGASALIAGVGDMRQFKRGSQLGAWLGLTPRQHSSGGKLSMGGITKRGNIYLRMLLIQGAKSVVLGRHTAKDPITRWARLLKERIGWQKAAVALANKNARILWAICVKEREYNVEYVSVNPLKSA